MALTCWPYRNTALRDGARTSTRTSSVAKGRTASIHRRPAPPRQTEALSSRTSRSRPLETSQPSGARAAVAEVFTENSSGRFRLEVGKDYLLLATLREGRFEIDNCGESGLFTERNKTIREIE